MKTKHLKKGKYIYWVTLFSLLLMISLVYFIYTGVNQYIIPIIIVWLLTLCIYIRSPKYCTIENNMLTIHRVIGKKIFDLNEYEQYKISTSDIRGAIRLFGNGGIFYIEGWFYSKKTKKYYALYTSDDILLLKHKNSNKKYIIDNFN